MTIQRHDTHPTQTFTIHCLSNPFSDTESVNLLGIIIPALRIKVIIEEGTLNLISK
jgi:hypothetical protein